MRVCLVNKRGARPDIKMAETLYILTGPTAAGKTALALTWAEANNAEILSCESNAHSVVVRGTWEGIPTGVGPRKDSRTSGSDAPQQVVRTAYPTSYLIDRRITSSHHAAALNNPDSPNGAPMTCIARGSPSGDRAMGNEIVGNPV